jgi:hypothetical protein
MGVFADRLMMARTVMPFGDGVLACVPPNLIYSRNTNGNGVPDGHTIIDEKVGQLGGRPRHMPKTPLWTLNNWIQLSRCGRADRT